MFFEQIPTQYSLFFILYGGTAIMALIAAVYLCLRRSNAFAPGVTPPVRLRRWATTFLGFAFLSHVWWFLFYIYSNDFNSVLCLVVAVVDDLALLTSVAGMLFAMLQDRKRHIWPLVVAMLPYVGLLTMNVLFPDKWFLHTAIAYLVVMLLVFSIYMVFAVRQYGHWLRDNYADLEHKEVWVSHVLIFVILLMFSFNGVAGVSMVISYLVHLGQFFLFSFLLWRVETLPQLETVTMDQQQMDQSIDQQPIDQQPQQPMTIPSNIEQLLAEHCVDTKLYLQHDLTLSQLAQAVGTNRLYLSHYFSRQGITYNAYINDLRISYFMSLYHEKTAAGQPIVAQQLASASGYRSYSTFSLAFKQRTGQSVTAWLHSQSTD